MWRAALIITLVTCLPGAFLFRFPIAKRSIRASLPIEERLFWVITLSVGISSVVALTLAWSGIYHIDRLLFCNASLCIALAIASGGRLLLKNAPWPSWSAIGPTILILTAVSVFFFVPPSEYVMGGRDPGVYLNEGVQIAQRGSLIIDDPVVRAVPQEYRQLFFQPPPITQDITAYDSLRFMGFFILDPTHGTVVGQFPHLYPTWIAIAYDSYGLTGARYVLGLSAILGILAVYFAGAHLLGRPAAFVGAALLTVHVTQVWFSRFPNAELIMQPFVFAGLLAYARAHVDNDRFFAPVAGVLLGLSVFIHFTGVLVIGSVGIATLFGRYAGQRVHASFVLPLTAMTIAAVSYYLVILAPYSVRPIAYVESLETLHWSLIGSATAIIIGLAAAATYSKFADRVRKFLPLSLSTAVWLSAIYALFIRQSSGILVPDDIGGLRTYTDYYLLPVGLILTLIGWTIVSRKYFWRGTAFFAVAATFAFFIFYRTRIVPEHFWMARRFVPIILPVSLLLIGATFFMRINFSDGRRLAWAESRAVKSLRIIAGTLLVSWLGWQYAQGTRPILNHVEFAGFIPKLEELASRFTSEDLLLIESRGASDVHVLATPLDYIYARNTLVFNATNPDKLIFRSFLEWARGEYSRVFFIGSGGTDLLSRHVAVQTITGHRFQIPQYEATLNAYPTQVRFKEFDYGIYEFVDRTTEPDVFVLDVGHNDDLHVRRIHAKQSDHNDVSYRWTRGYSYISVIGTRSDARTITIRMSSGGRPSQMGLPHVRLKLNDRDIGEFAVSDGFQDYTVTIPEDVAQTVASRDEASILVLESDVWFPSEALGVSDKRDLGVMLDRVEIR